MTDFRSDMEIRNKTVKRRLQTLPPLNPYSYHGKQMLADAWGNHVAKNTKVDVRADMTLKQSIEVNSAPVLGAPKTTERIFINEGYAISNITAFLNRLNYACYKHAFKRYGKKLQAVSCIQGGDADLREGMTLSDIGKRLHTHILLELPTHMDFATFKELCERHWKDTKWGYDVNNVELINSHHGSAQYNAADTIDSIDLQNTNFDYRMPSN